MITIQCVKCKCVVISLYSVLCIYMAIEGCQLGNVSELDHYSSIMSSNPEIHSLTKQTNAGPLIKGHEFKYRG